VSQPYLEVIEVKEEGRSPGVRFAVARFPCIVGRHPDCDRRLDLGFISRHHARFFLREGVIWVEDLVSHNGTFINGDRLKEARALRDGDKLALGHLLMRVSLVERDGDASTYTNAEATEGGQRRAVADDEVPSTRLGTPQAKSK
jgi:pSer/pThr/pTyr-binding forkhead associated (FHA) protein